MTDLPDIPEGAHVWVRSGRGAGRVGRVIWRDPRSGLYSVALPRLSLRWITLPGTVVGQPREALYHIRDESPVVVTAG